MAKLCWCWSTILAYSTKYNWLALAIFAVACALRFSNLTRPLWIDEVLYVEWLKVGARQEFIPVWIGRLVQDIGLTGDVWLRVPFALAGAVTPLAVWWVLRKRDHRVALLLSALVAVYPLFVFWSQLARPYAMAGLFVALAWVHPAFMFGGLLCTPFAITGLCLAKWDRRAVIYALVAIILAVAAFKIRPDSGRDFLNWRFLTHAHRLWYIPALSLILHFGYWLGAVDRLSWLRPIQRLARRVSRRFFYKQVCVGVLLRPNA
jgi:Dolichyl-phosphate-mannose-protein mannosyltransferase